MPYDLILFPKSHIAQYDRILGPLKHNIVSYNFILRNNVNIASYDSYWAI